MTNLFFFDRFLESSLFDEQNSLSSKENSLAYILQNIATDTEYLLQSRRFFQDIPPYFKELKNSVLTFGTQDFSILSESLGNDLDMIRLELEKTLTLSEPRLSHISLTIQNSKPPLFILKAHLNLDSQSSQNLAQLEFQFSHPHFNCISKNTEFQNNAKHDRSLKGNFKTIQERYNHVR